MCPLVNCPLGNCPTSLSTCVGELMKLFILRKGRVNDGTYLSSTEQKQDIVNITHNTLLSPDSQARIRQL